MRAPTPNDVGITQRLSYTLSWKWVKFLVLQNSYSKKNDVRKQLARSKAMHEHDIPLVEYEEDIDANRYKEDKWEGIVSSPKRMFTEQYEKTNQAKDDESYDAA